MSLVHNKFMTVIGIKTKSEDEAWKLTLLDMIL